MVQGWVFTVKGIELTLNPSLPSPPPPPPPPTPHCPAPHTPLPPPPSAQPRRTVGNVPFGVLRRLTIDPNADPDTYIVKSQVLDDYGYELPRINDAFDGKPYSFFYALSSQVNF